MATTKTPRTGRPREAPPQPTVGPITEAFEKGDELSELEAMYRRLALQMDNTETHARDLASMMRQARELRADINKLREEAAAGAEPEEPETEAYS